MNLSKLFYKKSNLFFIVLWSFCFSYSQNHNSTNFTSAKELPNNAVRALFVDSQHFLWIGTENGLVYKENSSFKSYFEEDGLAMNNCWAIAEDSSKKMWFGSYGGGLSIYNGESFKVLNESNGLVHNEITKLFSFKDKMYVGTSDGVSVVDIKTNEIVSSKGIENQLFRVSSFFEFNNHIYCTTYNSGIYKITVFKENIVLSKMSNHKFIYSAFKQNDSIFSSNKSFISKTKLSSFVSKSDTISMSKIGTSVVWDYCLGPENRKFAAAWGIYKNDGGIYEIENSQFNCKNTEFNIQSKEVISLAYNSKIQKLYVGTKDNGLYEVDLKETIHFSAINENRILSCAETQKTKAILYNNSLTIDKGDRSYTVKSSQFKKWEENYLRTTKIALPKHSNHFYELDYATKADDIKYYDVKVFNNLFWINTSIGIFVLNDNGEFYKYLPLHTEELNFTANGKLIETNPYHGVRVYKDLDKFEYTYYGVEQKTTPTMVVNSFRFEGKTYFLSIFSGLYAWQNNQFVSYVENNIWLEKKLKHVTKYGGNIAISNEFGDIFIINDTNNFEIIAKIPRSKIQGNSISFLNEFKGNLLIGTEKGLTIYKGDKFIFLNEEQGLKQPFFSSRVEGNELCIGSDNGYYRVKLLDAIKSDQIVDQIHLKNIKVNNQEVSTQDVVNGGLIILPYNKNNFNLRFSTNAISYPNKLVYQYRLNKDSDWSEMSKYSEIYLPYLSTGKHNVEVKVADLSTGLTYSQVLLKIQITPPFWKSLWFILLIIIVVFLLLLAFYKRRIERLKKFEAEKSIIKKRVEEVKMEALLAQMNPHFIFNAMNSIQKYIIDSDIDNALLYLGGFSKLIRKNLEYCTRPYILLIEEVEYLNSYIFVENKRFDNRVSVELNVDKSIDVYSIEIPSMIVQPFIENVFVHAFPPSIKDPKLTIDFTMKTPENLICSIKDNGVGISKEPKKMHKSKGLLLVKERLKLLGYNLEKTLVISSGKNEGTTVVISLKV